MPAVKLRKRVSPTNQFNKALQQINGLYVHSSPPKGHYRLLADIEEITTLYVHTCPPRVLQMNPSVIRQWLRGGEIDQLEQVVLEGQGHKLIGEYSPDPRVRNFLKIVPNYMTRIGAVNEAVNKGDLKRVRELLQVDENDSMMKNIALCKDLSGVGLLHKAVYRDHPNIVEYLVNNYPQTLHIKDRDGKTALHYCGACGDPEGMWHTLVNAGADPNIVDVRGRTPAHYMERPGDIELPEPKLPSGNFKRFTSGKDGLVVKPSNIRIWIHDRDLGRLQQVIWEGHGGKLRTETSNNPKVKRFLDGVPYIMNAIKDVHAAVINNDFEQYIKKTSDPIPIEILGSKDVNGLNPLHKAAGLGRRRIVDDILERNPKLVFTTDAEGRTPLHYAAALKDSGAIYDLLIDNGADEMAFDSNGKMASYYKQNPKELQTKVLEVIPDAPRTSVTFPPTWDWGLLQSSLMGSVGQIGSIMTNQMRTIEQNKREFEDNNRNRLRPPDDMFGREPERLPPRELKRLPPREPERLPPREEIPLKKEAPIKLMKKEPSIEKNVPAKGVDIWTNTEEDKNHRGKTDDEDEGEDEEDEEQNEMEINKGYESDHRNKENNLRNRVESDDEELRRMNARNEHPSPKKAIAVIPMKAREMSFHREEEAKQLKGKTEREIGEERQRMLDEGLIKLPSDDYDDGDDDKNEDVKSGDSEVDEIIRNGDMEKLASMVLNGQGDKLLGKRSRNQEIQSFLDNVPIYMTKIKTVHKAAREGEIRELQAALDRRRFAIAKDSSNPLGVTPLHVATLFGRTPIVKYLGGRFPETLNAKDKNGRTPLHYAATIPDNGHYFNVLLNLGADRKVKDNFGRVPGYYLENPGQLTQDSLLREFNAPAQIAREILSDKEFPVFGTDEGKYLVNALGEPLVRGLTEIASKRPREPITFLANFLYDFVKKHKGVSSPVTDPSIHAREAEIKANEGVPLSKPKDEDEDEAKEGEEENNGSDSPQTAFSSANRDEYGQSMLHFAAARAHGRGGLFQLIQESAINIGYRDELYRTARDVALQANIPENINEIDKYVLSLAARGETEKLIELLLEGYDHLLDIEDDEDNNIVDVVTKKNQTKTLAFLKSIPNFEEKRERIHRAIRAGETKTVQDMVTESEGGGRLLVIGKNTTGRCSLHVAVLCQQELITEFIAQKFPETLKIGDNLERTALHYAMGVEKVEILSKILIKCGAKRILKDLKGRQPTYYFMNKSEILRLQEEEELLRI